MLLWHLRRTGGLAADELGELLGLQPATVTGHLEALQSVALTAPSPTGAPSTWVAASRLALDAAAAALGTTGRLDQLAAQHHAQRVAFAAQLAERDQTRRRKQVWR